MDNYKGRLDEKSSKRNKSRSTSRSRRRDDKYKSSRKRDSSIDRKKAKKRSRTRSRSRSRSRSRKRNERDIKKEKLVEEKLSRFSNFDTKPGKGSNFTEQAPSEMIMPMAASSGFGTNSMHAMAIAQAAKVDRKLYIGNLPTGITPSTLVKLLNAALLTLQPNNAPGDPVLSAWISTDGHYAFVEFRTAEEANCGFLLNNISILGQPLKVGRPKTYVGALSMMDDGNLCNTVAAALQAGTMNAPIIGRKVQFPTRVICLKNITKNLNLEDEDEFREIYEDIRDECGKYGRVMSVAIPRKDENGQDTLGMGNAYVEFYTIEESKESRRQLSSRKFNKLFITVVYFSEDKYAKKELALPDEERITLDR